MRISKTLKTILEDLELVGLVKVRGEYVEFRPDLPILLVQCVEEYVKEVIRNYAMGLTKRDALRRLLMKSAEELLLEGFNVCLMDMISIRRQMLGISKTVFTRSYLTRLGMVKKAIIETLKSEYPDLFKRILKTVEALKRYYQEKVKLIE